MKYYSILSWVIVLGMSVSAPQKCEKETPKKVTVSPITFDQFQSMVANVKDDRLYIYNFWATWCKPCVAEMPYFEKIQQEYQEQVKLVFVSLDNPKNLEKRVIPFVREKQIEAPVILINEKSLKAEYINSVNKEWGGAIPATLFVRKNNKIFHEGDLDYEQLKAKIEPLL